MTEDVNPRWPMTVVLILALASGVSISEALKAMPAMLAGDLVAGAVLLVTIAVAFFSISLIAFIVYAMDRVSGRVVRPIRMFARLLEASHER